ncbi:hypothetical protein DM075_09335 [Klebsiella pneumoniae]|nr:hypothetical protein DM075_09335 [Klebsiella pneumoniae]
MAQVLSFQELIKFTAVMPPYPGYLLCRFFCRVAAVPYPAYTLHYRAIVAPVSAAPPGSGGVITPKWPCR